MAEVVSPVCALGSLLKVVYAAAVDVNTFKNNCTVSNGLVVMCKLDV